MFSVSRELDPNFVWDGDGPDPQEEGFNPYDVTVACRTVINGEQVEGESYLGGCYFQPDEPIGEIHGYLTQMVEEALDDLVSEPIFAQLSHHDRYRHLPEEIAAAQAVLKSKSEQDYAAQQNSPRAKAWEKRNEP